MRALLRPSPPSQAVARPFFGRKSAQERVLARGDKSSAQRCWAQSYNAYRIFDRRLFDHLLAALRADEQINRPKIRMRSQPPAPRVPRRDAPAHADACAGPAPGRAWREVRRSTRGAGRVMQERAQRLTAMPLQKRFALGSSNCFSAFLSASKD